MRLKGYRLTRALWASKMIAWGVAVVLCVLAIGQVAALAGLGDGPRGGQAGARGHAAGDPGDADASSADASSVDAFAVIWQRLDPEPPRPKPKQETEPVRQELPQPSPPAPDPFPDLQLLGTFTEDGHDYALLQIRRGQVKLLREGQEFEGIEVVGIAPDEATVETPGGRRTLRIVRETN